VGERMVLARRIKASEVMQSTGGIKEVSREQREKIPSGWKLEKQGGKGGWSEEGWLV